ncbi:MAG: family 20 glycosylhydrolase, partial [Candidatus Gallimonas sp.]
MVVEINEEKIRYGFAQAEKYISQPLKNKFTRLKAEKSCVNALTIKDGAAEIRYTDLSGFYTVLGVALATEGDFSSEITKKIKDTGVMLDCARNAVIRPEQAKKMIVTCALLGFNYFELYVEDCFEVDGEPCFGYMRGRFTKAELKELDAFASLFGVELVPCIQTLAHLARIFFHWKEYTAFIQDKGDVLLVGEERTYRLIENMIKTCRECFSSRRINIGMDEAFDLGQGKYFEKHGFVPKNTIIREHLAKVVEICKKYGFYPSIWADMFYDNLKNGEYDKVSKDAKLIFWEYWCEEKKYYDDMFDLLERSGADYAFAGGATKWISFAPHNKESELRMKIQFDSATDHGVNDYLLTCWGDDGAEAAHFSVLPCFCYLAMLNLGLDEGYLQNVCRAISGYTHEEFCLLDLPNEPRGKSYGFVNPAKYLLYEDAFISGEEYSTQPDFP